MGYSPGLGTVMLLLLVATTVFLVPVCDQNDSNDFDYFVFRQIWPAATCMFPEHHKCKIPKNVDTWVVHGLW